MVVAAEIGLDLHPFAALDAEGRRDRLAGADVFLPAAQRFHRLVGGTEIAALDAEAEERSEEHTSELQSLMRISYAVFCLKKNTHSEPKKPNNPSLTNK